MNSSVSKVLREQEEAIELLLEETRANTFYIEKNESRFDAIESGIRLDREGEEQRKRALMDKQIQNLNESFRELKELVQNKKQ